MAAAPTAMSAAPVIYELAKSDKTDFFFINGPLESSPAIGVAEQYDGPYYRFLNNDVATSPEEFSRECLVRGMTLIPSSPVCDFLEQQVVQHPDEPFDGVLGFSEDCFVAPLRPKDRFSISPSSFAQSQSFASTAVAQFWQKGVRVGLMCLLYSCRGAWNLYKALSGSDLDFIIMLSSVSGIVGNPGQSVYAASNAFLDSFAAYRNRLGLAASTINIGVVDTVATITKPVEGGNYQQTVTGLRLQPGKTAPNWALDPKFVHVLQSHQAKTAPNEQSGNANTTRQLLKQAETLDTVIQVICEAMAQ
ncbi:MAG: hypothetical protein LQ339_008811 [Xanthoria mediterranea]|nr:MAG: hypothetical protein LQ339_008811 [Xanthoria mediterranea]